MPDARSTARITDQGVELPGSSPRRVLYVVDRDVATPGRAARRRAVAGWLEGEGFEVSWWSLPPSTSSAGRAFGAARSWPAVVEAARGCERVVVEGLVLPYMAVLAATLARSPQVTAQVYFDVCDSWRRHEIALLRLGKPAASLLLGTGMRLADRIARPDGLLYVSAVDAAADAPRGRTSVSIVPLEVSREVSGLPAYRGPAERIVVPADFDSPYNALGLTWLAEVLEQHGAGLPPVETFGCGEPPERLRPHVRHRGWAPSVTDVYAGESVVFAANTYGAGVPNKVLEGLAAGRPTVAAVQALAAFPLHPLLFGYSTQAGLVHTLRRAVAVQPAARAHEDLTHRGQEQPA